MGSNEHGSDQASTGADHAADVGVNPQKIDRLIGEMLEVVNAVTSGNYGTFCHLPTIDDGPIGALGLGINLMVSDIAEAMQNVQGERQRVEAILTSLPDPVFTVDVQRQVIFLNPAACALLGVTPAQAVGRPVEAVIDLPELRGDTEVTRAWRGDSIVRGKEIELARPGGVTVHVELTTAALTGPGGQVGGGVVILRDVTEQKEREHKLLEASRAIQEQVDIIRNQQDTISQLGTPILRVWDDVLAIPIVGVVDSSRTAEVMDRLLEQIVTTQARCVIIDITGVDVVDTRTADNFVKMVKAAGLVGARCVMTGLSPAVAQTIVDIGVDLSSVVTLRNLQDGLRYCMRLLGDDPGSDRRRGAPPGASGRRSGAGGEAT